jgi:hypothetical protein
MLDLGFLQNDIEKLQEKICPCEIKEGEGLGLEDEFHCTVLYGIHESKPYDVISKLDLKPAKFTLSGISLFKNDRYDVLKFDVTSKDLTALNKQVREKCSYTSDYPEYHAHATIAYLEKGKGKYYTKLKSNLIGKQFTSDRYIFSNPQGEKVFHKCK